MIEILPFGGINIVFNISVNAFIPEVKQLIQNFKQNSKSLNQASSVKITILDKRTFDIPNKSKRLSPGNSRFKIFRLNDIFYFSFNESQLRIDLQNREATGYFAKTDLEQHPSVLSHRFLFPAIVMLLHTRNTFALHSAALEANTVGYLFAAQSGSGKSTNTIHLVEAGWNYLSDELIFLRLGEKNAVEALAIPSDFTLDTEFLKRNKKKYLTKQDISIPKNGKIPSLKYTKRLIKIDAIYPEQFTKSCTPKVIIHPVLVDKNKSKLISINKIEMLKVLMEESPLLSIQQTAASKHLDVLKYLVNQCDNYRLFAGKDLLDGQHRINDIMQMKVSLTKAASYGH